MIRNIGCYVPGLWPKPSTCEQGRSFHLSVRRDTSKRTSAVRGEGAFRILSIANNSDLMHLRLKRPEGKWRGWSRSGCFFDTVECGCPPAFWAKSCATAVWRRMQSNVKIYWRAKFGNGKLEKNAPWLGKFSIRHSTKLSNDAPKKLAGHWTGTQGCWSSASFSSAVYADKKETLRAIFGFDDVVNDHVVQHQSSQSFHSWLTLAGRSRVKLWLRVHINTLSPQVSSKFVPFAFNFPYQPCVSSCTSREAPGLVSGMLFQPLHAW